MGNVAEAAHPPADHLLELRLASPQIPVQLGRCGNPCELVAEVSEWGRREATAVRVVWDKAVTVRVSGDKGVAVVTIFALDPSPQPGQMPQFVAEVCIPYGDEGGLVDLGVRAGGAVVPLKLALTLGLRSSQAPRDHVGLSFLRSCRQFRKDHPFLALSVRELPQEMPIDPGNHAGVTTGKTRREAIALEFENAALEAHRRATIREPDMEPPECSQQSHVKQLQLILEDNARLEAEKSSVKRQLEDMREQGTQKNRTQQVMQLELESRRERHNKIRAGYQERISALQLQLEEARSRAVVAESALEVAATPVLSNSPSALGLSVMGDVGGESAYRLKVRISVAKDKRADLDRQLQDLQQVQLALAATGGGANPESPLAALAGLSENPIAWRLMEESKAYKTELTLLQQELAQQHERERGSETQQQLRQEVQRFYEELDEQHQIREDERVRSESEVRELRKERDAACDLLDDALAEVRRLRAKAEALRDIGAAPPGSSLSLAGLGVPASQVDLAKQIDENMRHARELECLRQEEELRKARIAEMEREQETLVERIGFISSQAVLAERPDGAAGGGSYLQVLERRAADLEGELMAVEEACRLRREEVERIGRAAEETKARSESLRRSYDELQKISDERVFRVPQGATTLPLVHA